MTELERVLSDDDHLDYWRMTKGSVAAFGRAIEYAAVEAYKEKLEEQEPVAYRCLRPSTGRYVYFCAKDKSVKKYEPLYPVPMPTHSLSSYVGASWQPIEAAPSFTVLLLADFSIEGKPTYGTGMTVVSGKFIDTTETHLLTPTHWMQIPEASKGDK